MSYIIEAVCAGQNGRSPVMRLLAKKRLQELGIENRYDVDTSGIYVDQIGRLDFTRDQMARTLRIALPREIFDRGQKEVLQGILESNDGDLKPYFAKALPVLMEEERDYRTRVLESMGLDSRDIQPPRQTAVREGVVAYIAADKHVSERIKTIYEGRDNPQIIASASELAGLPEVIEIIDTFNYEIYESIIRGLAVRVPKAIDEVLRKL